MAFLSKFKKCYSSFLLYSFHVMFCLLIGSCGGDSSSSNSGTAINDDAVTFNSPWPTDFSKIFKASFSDGEGDQIALPVEMDAPPYADPVSFPSVDVTNISLGIEQDFLYMRVDYAGEIPLEEVKIPEKGEVESQIVKNQGMNISLNVDDDENTGSSGEGVQGVEIFFAVSFSFGIKNAIYANYDFPNGDIHLHQQQILGELGEGGPGYKYAIVRFDISKLGDFLPRGKTVELGSWSEAESFNEDGTLKYHHFAFDGFTAVKWDIPE
ncbi:MAG: hypothetical protein COA79_03465 [Planctomycetota bacterium]|nr:MAG: hypothetical protein COA79_03465 [Planctomycetota bacterium]